jgi:uncharacterized membrane protein
MNVRNFSHRILLIAAALFIVLPLALEAGKPVPVTVTAANPADATQGEELDVIVSGSGFDSGSIVSYLITGTADASQVTVQSVQYISSTQLKTRIKVNGFAPVTDYDIEVQASTGRKGKGTTLFKVNMVPDPSIILPVNLGVPAGSSDSSGSALNNGAYPGTLIVTSSSPSGTPHRWQSGAWASLGLLGNAASGYTTGVSDVGSVVGTQYTTTSCKKNSCTGVNSAFVSSNGIMEPLPLLNGMAQSFAEGISADGQHPYGYNTLTSQGTGSAVRWSRNSAGAWYAEMIGDPVKQQNGDYWLVTGSSDDGSVLVGYGRYGSSNPNPALRNVTEGWVWVEGGSPAWASLGLRVIAHDIDPTASMLVGTRYHDNGDTTFTPVAVFWRIDGTDSWSRNDLVGLGGQGSVAYGVGRLNDGDLVIVGFANTPGNPPIRKAVAWMPDSQGTYGPPIQLAAINGSTSQFAAGQDVNANGIVVGYSDTGGGRRAVLWQLPVNP